MISTAYALTIWKMKPKYSSVILIRYFHLLRKHNKKINPYVFMLLCNEDALPLTIANLSPC